MAESGSLGMSAGNTMAFMSNEADTDKIYKKMSKSVANVRGMSSVSYSATLDNFAATSEDDD